MHFNYFIKSNVVLPEKDALDLTQLMAQDDEEIFEEEISRIDRQIGKISNDYSS